MMVLEASRSPDPTAGIYDDLKRLLGHMGGVVVAYSGGVDSSLVLAAALDSLGSKALGVTACSPTYTAEERERALTIAQRLGARHLLVGSAEMDDPAFASNPPNRCYFCKKELFGLLRSIADREGLACVVDGSNHDDLDDVRPGRIAAREAGVRSPLLELGIGKQEVRHLAKMRGLPNWNEPSGACLASRIPFGETITNARLDRVARAEHSIKNLGFRQFRVRDHGVLARIEIGKDDLARSLRFGTRQCLIKACKAAGYRYACVDLEGYRTGSMNLALLSTKRSDSDEGHGG